MQDSSAALSRQLQRTGMMIRNKHKHHLSDMSHGLDSMPLADQCTCTCPIPKMDSFNRRPCLSVAVPTEHPSG